MVNGEYGGMDVDEDEDEDEDEDDDGMTVWGDKEMQWELRTSAHLTYYTSPRRGSNGRTIEFDYLIT